MVRLISLLRSRHDGPVFVKLSSDHSSEGFEFSCTQRYCASGVSDCKYSHGFHFGLSKNFSFQDRFNAVPKCFCSLSLDCRTSRFLTIDVPVLIDSPVPITLICFSSDYNS